MGSDWEEVSLGNYVTHQKGYIFKSKDYQDEGRSIVRVSDFTNRSINILSCNKIDETRANELDTYKLEKHDVVIATVGSWPKNPASIVGKTIQVPIEASGALLNQNAVRLRANNEINQRFIFLLLKTRDFQNYIVSTAQGSANQASITLKDIFRYSFNLPKPAEQKAIAHILGSLDDKIELNRQMNETLESMAQALFKSWFVDFGPVIDNALAEGNAIPDVFAERAEQRRTPSPPAPLPEVEGSKNNPPLPSGEGLGVRGLFPSEFEYTEEMGWIPKGWGISSLANLTTELRRGISPKYTESDGVSVVNQRCIRNHSINFSLCRKNDVTLRKVEGRFLELGDLLINSTGVGTLGRMAQVIFLDEPTVVDSHVTVARPDRDKYRAYTFARMMLSIEVKVESMGLGSTGQTELSRKDVSELMVVVPSIQVQDYVESTFKDYADKAVAILKSNLTLTKLRDTLLPKLLSGELRIPDAEKLIAEVI